MADYYPLIAKAVAGLDKSTGEARRALYERARTALVTQLRGVVPALSESDITRERLGLEEAIRKVEAEAARKSRFDAPPERKRVEIADPFKAAAPPRREAAAPAAQTDENDDSDDPESTLSGTAADLRRPVRTPPTPSSRAAEGMKEFRNVVADAENLGDATAQAGRSGPSLGARSGRLSGAALAALDVVHRPVRVAQQVACGRPRRAEHRVHQQLLPPGQARQ